MLPKHYFMLYNLWKWENVSIYKRCKPLLKRGIFHYYMSLRAIVSMTYMTYVIKFNNNC